MEKKEKNPSASKEETKKLAWSKPEMFKLDTTKTYAGNWLSAPKENARYRAS